MEPNLVKKSGFTENVIKKQKPILIIAVIGIIILFAGTSYSLLTNFDTGGDNNILTFQEGDLKVTLNKAGLITLDKNVPETDEKGLLNSVPVVLTMTNTGNVNVTKYNVILNKDSISTLDEKYIKYAISTDYGVSYSKATFLNENSNIIYTGYNLDVNKSKTIYLRMWLDKDADETALNKNYYANVELKLERTADIPFANSKIMETLNTKNGVIGINADGLVANNKEKIGEYRYSGLNVNNYVKYNNEIWRILGVFEENNENYLKIVRNEILDDGKFSTNYEINGITYEMKKDNYNPSYTYFNKDNAKEENNTWDKSGLMNYLNSTQDAKKNYGYLSYLTNDAKNMLRKTTYYYGQVDIDNDTFVATYQNEKMKNWQGQVALMNVSDYVYTTDSSNFVKDFKDLEETKKTSWFYESTKDAKNLQSWTMTLASEKNNVINLNVAGLLENSQVDKTLSGIRPVVSLKSNILIMAGEGTEENPYILSL